MAMIKMSNRTYIEHIIIWILLSMGGYVVWIPLSIVITFISGIITGHLDSAPEWVVNILDALYNKGNILGFCLVQVVYIIEFRYKLRNMLKL